ncbi:MAG: DUF1592 domain-containing protein, partial [Gammaproteobacteria bacterium]|nr:DUF1592 domain-containing protein [Gammaproteobacteria bacterium]
HRLNRTEYATAVEDLLGVRIDARAMLPADVSSDGFDNVANVLRVSPTHLDQYLAAARDISIMAVGDPKPEPDRADYRTTTANQTVHIDGLPLGTRGGILTEHMFPADGEYVFNLNVTSEPGAELRAYPQGWLEYRHKVILTLDGERVFEGELGGPEDLKAVDQQQIAAVEAIKDRFRDIRLDVKAGRHEVAATFVARTYAESDQLLHSQTPGVGEPSVPLMLGVEIIGPYEPTGISESTVSRERIFICRPETEADELPCAEKILSNLAHRAFRRPVSDEDLEPILDFYRAGRESGDFENGIQKGLMAILASTKFLYRAEPDGPPEDLAPGSPYLISDLELAWRLSFFLWSQGPDETLLTLAEQGKLRDEGVFDEQVARMLEDPRAKSLVTNFAFQWLEVRRLDQIDPDSRLYPNFDEDLREAFKREMELFLESILLEDRSVTDLLTAKHTFVNERLARHYGIPSVRGDRFRRIELEDSRRWGLFGKGSMLMVTSYPDRTSPVLRGAWIMEHILATPPAPVPPNVETDLAQPEGDIPRSVRERLALHRTEPSCNHCHGVIDPLGQALENYNAIGEWRVRERHNGVPIDSSGQLAGGTKVNGPDDLRAALMQEPEQFVQALTEKLMTFALGRGVEYHDMPTVRAIVREAAENDYHFSAIVKGIAGSAPFQMREKPEQEEDDLVSLERGSESGAPQALASETD